MANEKISEFAIDADIEDIDGLAAMTITSGTSLPIEYGNVAVPGYAFTLENVLKTKTNRTDPDPNNWADVVSNRVPRGTQSGTSVDFREGLTFGGDTSSTDFPDLLSIQGDPVETSTINFIGYEKGGDFQNPIEYAKVNWKYIEGFKVQTSTSATSASIQLISSNSNTTGNEVEIYAGRDNSSTNSVNSIHIWNRNKGGKVQLESANDLFIKTGVASGNSSAGASKKLYIKPANSTSITTGQVLTSMGTDGETEWQDNDNTEYTIETKAKGTTDVILEFLDNAATPAVVGSLTFEGSNGIDITSNLTVGEEGSFSIDLDLTNASGVGILPVSSGGTGVTSLSDGHILLGSGNNAISTLDLTAKGSIVVGDGTTDPIALGVGGDGDVLTADSNETSGLKWATPSGGAQKFVLTLAYSFDQTTTALTVRNLPWNGNVNMSGVSSGSSDDGSWYVNNSFNITKVVARYACRTSLAMNSTGGLNDNLTLELKYLTPSSVGPNSWSAVSNAPASPSTLITDFGNNLDLALADNGTFPWKTFTPGAPITITADTMLVCTATETSSINPGAGDYFVQIYCEYV